MIRNIRHRGLKRLYEKGDASRLPAAFADKIARFLFALDHAVEIKEADLPGFRLHRLSGDLADFWSATISANWRIVFRFEDGDAFDVDFVDYH